jgi:hypothetical protein
MDSDPPPPNEGEDDGKAGDRALELSLLPWSLLVFHLELDDSAKFTLLSSAGIFFSRSEAALEPLFLATFSLFSLLLLFLLSPAALTFLGVRRCFVLLPSLPSHLPRPGFPMAQPVARGAARLWSLATLPETSPSTLLRCVVAMAMEVKVTARTQHWKTGEMTLLRMVLLLYDVAAVMTRRFAVTSAD